MKLVKISLVLAAALLGATASGSALAFHHSSVRFGVFVGGPAWYPYPYPYPYYPPAVVVQPAPPTTYIEQAAPETSEMPSGYWYYCAASKAYYPYVKDCPAGWQRVAPQPQSSR